MGNHPVETVGFMRDITTKAEELMIETRHLKEPEAEKSAEEFLAYAACLLAEKSLAKAIVTHTMTGTAARHVSTCRPSQPIYALTPSRTSLKGLNFSWGVLPQYLSASSEGDLLRTENFIMQNPTFATGEDIIITAGQSAPHTVQPRGTNFIKIFRK